MELSTGNGVTTQYANEISPRSIADDWKLNNG